METISIKNSRGLKLAADLYQADSDKVIVMSHGFGYDRHEKQNKFDKIASAFNKANYNVITFDFSGAGESDDDTLSISKQTDDLKSVIKFSKDKRYKNIILFGVSLGALSAFRCHDQGIKAIIGVGPVTYNGGINWRENKFDKDQIEEFKKTGKLIYNKPSGPRDHIVLSMDYVLEKEAVDQKELLKDIKCPILIIHSDGDEFIPLEVSQKAVEILGDRAELYVLQNGRHAFLEHIDTVINKSLDWLKENKL